MALASGCGDGRNNTKSTESTRQSSQSAISAESTEGGMANGPTKRYRCERKHRVLTDLPTTLKTGAEDIKNRWNML